MHTNTFSFIWPPLHFTALCLSRVQEKDTTVPKIPPLWLRSDSKMNIIKILSGYLTNSQVYLHNSNCVYLYTT